MNMEDDLCSTHATSMLYLVFPCHSRTPTTNSFSCQKMAATMNLTARLDAREEVHPSELDKALDTRARMHRTGAPYTPIYPTLGRLFPGTYYLVEIDAQWRRHYNRVPSDAPVLNASTSAEGGNQKYVDLAPPSAASDGDKKRPLES